MKSTVFALLFLFIANFGWAQEQGFLATITIEEVSLDTKIKFDYHFKDLKSFKEFNVKNLIDEGMSRKNQTYHIFMEVKKINDPKESSINLSSLNMPLKLFESNFLMLKEQVIKGIERIY